jgi:hypothetical protein
MPAVAKKVAVVRPASTPAVIDASKLDNNGQEPADEIQTPPSQEQIQEVAARLASTDPVFNPDGSITVPLAFPPNLAQYNVPALTGLTSVTLRQCKWKDRKAAMRRTPANGSALDSDSAMIAELSGIPEYALDEFDSRDMSNIQIALGKLLFPAAMMSNP